MSTLNSYSQRTGVLPRNSDVSYVITSNDTLGANGMSHDNKESVLLLLTPYGTHRNEMLSKPE